MVKFIFFWVWKWLNSFFFELVKCFLQIIKQYKIGTWLLQKTLFIWTWPHEYQFSRREFPHKPFVRKLCSIRSKLLSSLVFDNKSSRHRVYQTCVWSKTNLLSSLVLILLYFVYSDSKQSVKFSLCGIVEGSPLSYKVRCGVLTRLSHYSQYSCIIQRKAKSSYRQKTPRFAFFTSNWDIPGTRKAAFSTQDYLTATPTYFGCIEN